jgi:nitrate reductase NapE component
MITGHLQLGFSDQLVGFWGQSLWTRVAAIAMVGCFGLVLMFEIVNWLADSDASSVELLAFLALAILSWPAMIAVGVRRMSPQQRDVTYELDGERVVLRDAAGNSVSSPWTEVRTCRERPAGFVLTVGPGARWLPKRAFAPEVLPALRALIRERLGDKAKLTDT